MIQVINTFIKRDGGVLSETISIHDYLSIANAIETAEITHKVRNYVEYEKIYIRPDYVLLRFLDEDGTTNLITIRGV